MQSGGRVGRAALLRLPARPSAPPSQAGRPATLAPRPGVASSPVSLFRPTSPRRSLEVGSEGWGRGEVLSAPPPHPTPRALARGAGHDCLAPGSGPHGADPRGLCGVTDGGSLPRGRLPARRLPPLALDRSASAGRPLLWACRAVARRLPTPSEPRGLLPTPPPHASRGCLVRFSHLVVAPARLAPRFPSEPLPYALGGGGRVPGTRARVGIPVVEGRGPGPGGQPYGCAKWWGRALPVSGRCGRGGLAAGTSGRRSTGARWGPQCVTGRQR